MPEFVIMLSAFYVFVEVLNHMISRGQGHIVAVGSVQSRVAIPFRSACKYDCANSCLMFNIWHVLMV